MTEYWGVNFISRPWDQVGWFTFATSTWVDARLMEEGSTDVEAEAIDIICRML